MTGNESTIKSNSSDQIKKEYKEAKRKENEELKESQRQQNIRKNPEWMWDLQYDNFGNLKRSLTNYIGLLTKCDGIGQFKYDVYTKKRMYIDSTGKKIEFSDSLYREFFKWTEQYISPCDEKKCIDSMMYISDQNSYNSATQLLDNLIWDGVSRLETLFIDILGANDNPLIREMTKQWMVGAVQRLYNPGCKNENVLILTGSQGCGKTSTLMWLAGKLGFDNTIDISRSEQETGQKL
jgi:flagellar biosynthesis GTPase FlhF